MHQGGLTTPTCNEAVLWTNFMSMQTISEAQLAIFRTMTDSDSVSIVDNYRPPQPLNARTLYTTGVSPRTDHLQKSTMQYMDNRLSDELLVSLMRCWLSVMPSWHSRQEIPIELGLQLRILWEPQISTRTTSCSPLPSEEGRGGQE